MVQEHLAGPMLRRLSTVQLHAIPEMFSCHHKSRTYNRIGKSDGTNSKRASVTRTINCGGAEAHTEANAQRASVELRNRCHCQSGCKQGLRLHDCCWCPQSLNEAAHRLDRSPRQEDQDDGQSQGRSVRPLHTNDQDPPPCLKNQHGVTNREAKPGCRRLVVSSTCSSCMNNASSGVGGGGRICMSSTSTSSNCRKQQEQKQQIINDTNHQREPEQATLTKAMA